MSQSDEKNARDLAFYISMLVICVFSVLMNFLVLIVILKGSKRRISMDFYIFNLTLCDILQAGVVLPLHFKNAAESKEGFDGGEVECKLIMFLPLMAVMASISTMVAIAIDRCQTIVRNRRLQVQHSLWIITGIWLISVSSPQLYEYNMHYNSKENRTAFIKECGSHGIVKNFQTIYAACVFLIAYAIPTVLLLVGYTCIIIHIWKTSLILRNQGPSEHAVNSPGLSNPFTKKKTRVLKMLITIVVVFILLWTPYFVAFAFEEIRGEDDTASQGGCLHIVGEMITTASTATNPIIYIHFSQKFRRSLAKVICWGKKLNNVVNPLI
ncbi:hypothetical protein CHS0354_032350 [Potamilus streckersoni]|uniref:G-protein coupled receptors family 1 profile domain-containing protein n=1 Tax=Potamilus streckersoni TaxID=2493646 RepID=A0AAE0WDA3_9BIVA|nr:hypothetical protein CHS0354_032350 [Potamilus streckersoni]